MAPASNLAPAFAPASAALALLQLRCPRCHEGKLFARPAWHLTRAYEMPARCPVCAQTYEPEPGFYYGAMFISFAFSVAIVLITGLVLYHFFGNPEANTYILTAITASLLLNPLSFRYSRALMLYGFGFIAYDPQWAHHPRKPAEAKPAGA